MYKKRIHSKRVKDRTRRREEEEVVVVVMVVVAKDRGPRHVTRRVVESTNNEGNRRI